MKLSKSQIPIIPQLREIFMELQPQASGNVFQVPEITLRRLFARALSDAGIKDCRFHDLRHTFASHFIMRTNNLPVLQEILGHATPQMTQRYAHLAGGHISMQMGIFAQGLATAHGRN
ncbi:MAG: site-specific integrase [Elusimicrobiales bacterium]|nr:site-specific integrase [Elusimicrobiales bacterium]